MEYEELVFGGDDPGHEPGLGPWVAAHTKLLTICAAVLVVFGLAGAGGWYLYERSWLPQPPPDVALSPSFGFQVDMCGCDGMVAATVEQRQEAEAMLRALPQVTSVEVQSGQERSEQLRRSFERIGDTRRAQSSSLPGDVLHGTLRRAEDFPSVVEKMRSAPMISTVSRSAVNFWAGRAEAEIALCGKDFVSQATSGCQKVKRGEVTGMVTEKEKAAIVARLRDLPGVETIYFQDPGHALKLAKLSDPKSELDGTYPGSFYVKFSDPALARTITSAIGPMPGVLEVWPVLSEE
ncbi:permease-like cell division protein FtsX [Streptosporangium subroseum]|uniref:permease-like cell division protein FtsX n=1 Tax=Streptosporangium subroseum TaxID=106412 RepID=UPI00308F4B40|nr:permease-like cell division protein FtsX [Streptosporangium subroseum]